MEGRGQSLQDIFVLHCTKFKRNGTFLEIGSNHPTNINNSYLLESAYGWRGIMVEYDASYLPLYKSIRPTAHHIIQDAQTVDWKKAVADARMPNDIDYLQIDLEVENGSTLNTLKAVAEQLMGDHRFACVTFEHDIYTGDKHDTRRTSREIFERHGYVRVFSDIKNKGFMYEDWYVHPELVDRAFIDKIKRDESMEYSDAIKIISSA